MSKRQMTNAEFAVQANPQQIEKQERKRKRKEQCWRVLKAFVKAHPLGLTDYELVGRMIGGTDGPRRRRELRRMGINFTVRSDASKGVSRWSLTNRQQGIDKLREQGIEISESETKQ